MLIWHAIVKNESAILPRSLASLLPHVDGAIVADTGSNDGTPDLIRETFAAANKPVEITSVPFENFAQARNAALQAARNSNMPWEYVLLSDADMSLIVEKPLHLNGGAAYDMEQIAGNSVRYWNRRILSRAAQGEYVCPTHEYLNVPSAGRIEGAYFLDHADGSNRPDKLKRDIDILENELKPKLSEGLLQRVHFYLAQSHFDSGNWAKAAEHYKRRCELGGWDEERWQAQYRYAHCLDNMGDQAGFLWNMLVAYEMRPQRAEALYDLAKFFRERGGANMRSLLFSEPGMQQSRPSDSLFVNDFVYSTGLREEFAISGFYDPNRRLRAAKVCNDLALDRRGTHESREQARNNLYWYLEPLSAHVPSFQPLRIQLQAPDGFVPLNPSVINHHGQPIALVRTVNYAITPEGTYITRGAAPERSDPHIIVTRNVLCRLSTAGAVEHQAEILPPQDWPEPKFNLVRGFEDSRLFEWGGQLWTLSTVRELTPEGWCEQVLAPIEHAEQVSYGQPWSKILAGHGLHEKNWMPWVRDGDLDLLFVYRLGTIVDANGKLVHQHNHKLSIGHISGGSQVIEVAPKLYLALVHEARHIPGRVNRFYQHRFVSMLADGSVLGLSPPFYFHDRQVEFAAGLARFGDQLLISYGIRDEEAWMASVRLDEVLRFCT